MKHITIISLFLFFVFGAFAQKTVGTITYENEALEGYTFFSPFSGTRAYMVDNCGNLVNRWDRGTLPGLSAYFLENGLMLRTFKADEAGPFTSASNAGGLELVDWDNNTVWSYEINTSEQLSHHDAVYMPNGNILVLTWQLIYTDDLIEWGRNPSEIASEGYMWSEKILELKPVGNSDAEIVWEWNIYDHYVQDYDPQKLNFGIVQDHPELFDINLPELNSSNSNSTRDWNHFNAIDYNEDLDQILISVRNSDEIWIIDHSTSTQQAAGHDGGVYGKGGDLLFRYGNRAAWKIGTTADQVLFGQHGVHWIDDGLEDAGKILIYNNGNSRPGPDYSQIDLVDPVQSEPGFYTMMDNEWESSDVVTIYGEEAGQNFYSPYLSNAQRLTNGNTLINQGSSGRIFEITPEADLVWEYEIPLFGDFAATQGDNVNNNGNFRAYKFDSDFMGFQDIELDVMDPIENNPSACQIIVHSFELSSFDLDIFYSNIDECIHIMNSDGHKLEIQFMNQLGQVLKTWESDDIKDKMSIADFSTNMYVLSIRIEGKIVQTKTLVK